MTPQYQLQQRIYELLPRKKGCTKSLASCGKIPCENAEHFDTIRLADLLMAIQRQWGLELMYYAGMRNGDKVQLLNICVGDKESDYVLSKDNILDQSDELCLLALDLLK